MSFRVSVFIATSLDGFIARPDGLIDWLNQASASAPIGEDFGYADFMSSVDVLVMGRHSFESVMTFDAWPYVGKRVIVLSSQTLTIPEHLAGLVEVRSHQPSELVAWLKSENHQHVYVDGGKTIQNFLASDLVDELTITVIPILLGEGRPLFAKLNRDLHLDLVGSKSFSCGFVQNTYRRKALMA